MEIKCEMKNIQFLISAVTIILVIMMISWMNIDRDWTAAVIAVIALLAFFVYRRLYMRISISSAELLLGVPVAIPVIGLLVRDIGLMHIGSVVIWSIFAVSCIISFGYFYKVTED